MEAAITFGASVITAIVTPMAERAGMEILDHFEKMVNIKNEITNLRTTLQTIQSVIQDAEERQIDDIRIHAWLRQLVDIGYEARDVLDIFFTYRSYKRAKASGAVNLNFLPPLFKSASSSSTVPIKTRFQLASAITNVRERLDELKRQNDLYLNLKSGVGSSDLTTVPTSQRPETSPFQSAPIVGRDAVKGDIMRKVLNHTNNDVHIIPIVGMGGIGKTTLAQSIYNDVRVTEDVYPTMNRVWLCVGEKELKAKEIIMSFVEGLNSTSLLPVIQKRLVEKFKGDKFLIVLDDVWEVKRREWKLLFEPLKFVGKGGVVILTTRRREVVDATNAEIPDLLQPLSDEDCWSIFESHAFSDGNSNSTQDLKFIGKQIVAKLKGLPLAAEIVGCSLKNEPDEQNWKSFLLEKKWLQKNEDDNIIPALKWSYNRLRPQLKQCFRYCSLFPKDYKFDEKILKKIWMAHDIIPNVERGGEPRTPVDVGAQYFKELVNASFFQRINKEYVMHDMIHDLALLVSNEDFITLSDEHSCPPEMDNVRHVSIIEDNDYAKNLRLCKSKKILTVYSVWNWYRPGFPNILFSPTNKTPLGKDDLFDVLKQCKSIRVLVLSDKSITKIPDCIKELIHLRYLDVRGTGIKILRDSLCKLYNLQTLSLPNDVDLPKNVGNLKILRHLTGGITCKVIGQLTSLEELFSVRVSKGDCISELRHLGRLRGELLICGLRNVKSSEDAAQARMQEKEFIDRLILHFMDLDGKPSLPLEECGISKDVFEALNCPPNLNSLSISDYNGDQFPSWLTNAANSMKFLSSLYISRCQVVELLQLDAVVCLKRLSVYSCSNLQRIRLAEKVAATIEHLFIGSCPELREMEIESLPELRESWITQCDKLISFAPCLVKIQDLKVVDCNLRSLRFTLDGIESLKTLEISGCPMLKKFFIVEEGSTSSLSSSSSSSITVLSLPDDDRYITLRNHKFEKDAEGRLVLNRR